MVFGLFGRRKPPNILFPLHFKDAAAAVEYASKYMTCKLGPGAELAAVVLDGLEWALPVSVQVTKSGNQMAALSVSGDGGPFLAFAETAGIRGPKLQPGYLVSWQPFDYIPELGKQSADERTGWAGLITGVLTLTLIEEGWVGKERFRP